MADSGQTGLGCLFSGMEGMTLKPHTWHRWESQPRSFGFGGVLFQILTPPNCLTGGEV